MFLGQGVGEASTDEEKYRWRRAVCDQEWDETSEDRRREKWSKRGRNQTPTKVKQVRTEPADHLRAFGTKQISGDLARGDLAKPSFATCTLKQPGARLDPMSVMPEEWTQPDVVLAKIVADLARGRALDVGCGGGHDSLWLAEHGWSVTALDISRHAVSKVRKLAKRRGLDVTAIRGDVTTFDTEDRFDLISICYMHLPACDRAQMLANAARLLVPGGTLLFRSFEASIEEAPFDRSLLPSRDEVVTELGDDLCVEAAEVGDEYSDYLKMQ